MLRPDVVVDSDICCWWLVVISESRLPSISLSAHFTRRRVVDNAMLFVARRKFAAGFGACAGECRRTRRANKEQMSTVWSD
jgi:hypothetical protein